MLSARESWRSEGEWPGLVVCYTPVRKHLGGQGIDDGFMYVFNPGLHAGLWFAGAEQNDALVQH